MPFDSWMTPPHIIELAREMMTSIDLDPASHPVAQEYIKAKEFCALEIGKNGLDIEWYGNVWLNPPYSKGNIDKFVYKALDEWNISGMYNYGIKNMLILVNSATDSKWYHALLENCSAFCLWRGRIKFWKIENGQAYEKWEGEKSKQLARGKIGNSPRYLNTLFYFGDNVDRFRYYFGGKGYICYSTPTTSQEALQVLEN